MALDELEAASLVSKLWPDWLDNRDRSKEWENWSLGKQNLPVIPDSASFEHRKLQEKAITPWLGLLVQSLAQALIVEGYRSAVVDENSVMWNVWQANGMDSKQVALYEGALTTGVAYVAVLPTAPISTRRLSVQLADDVKAPEWRLYTSAEMTGFYESPHDDFPAYAVAGERLPRWMEKAGDPGRWRITMFDDTSVYILDQTDHNVPVVTSIRPHGLSVTPIVGYVNRQTITGRALGEVEPYVAVASRIDQDVFDRLIVQRYASWRVRTATGLDIPDSNLQPEAAAALKLELKASDILAGGAGVDFGSLPETQLDGHLRAPIEDVRMLAAVSQTPPTHLTGDLANISAEALAAIEAAYNRKVEQRKVSFGEAHEKAFALSSQILRQEVDHAAQVRWRDMESRSLGQVADAYGKFAQMLEIPVEVLWDKLGFLDDQDRQRARALRSEGDVIGDLLQTLANGQTSPEATQQQPGVAAVA